MHTSLQNVGENRVLDFQATFGKSVTGIYEFPVIGRLVGGILATDRLGKIHAVGEGCNAKMVAHL